MRQMKSGAGWSNADSPCYSRLLFKRLICELR